MLALADASVVPEAEDGQGDVVLFRDFALPTISDPDVAPPCGLDADGRDRGRARGRSCRSAEINGNAPGIPGKDSF